MIRWRWPDKHPAWDGKEFVSDEFTLAKFQEIRQILPPLPDEQYYTVSTALMVVLRRLDLRSERFGALSGIQVVECPKQKASAWCFRDRETFNKWLAGELTEMDLVDLMVKGECRSE